MRLPWVSRSALDVAQGEIGYLRAQVSDLLDRLTRVERHRLGMSEVPREPRPSMEPMPKQLHELINEYADPSIRKNMRDTLYRRHARGDSWADIIAERENRE